jgi:hypothetical protein
MFVKTACAEATQLASSSGNAYVDLALFIYLLACIRGKGCDCRWSSGREHTAHPRYRTDMEFNARKVAIV